MEISNKSVAYYCHQNMIRITKKEFGLCLNQLQFKTGLLTDLSKQFRKIDPETFDVSKLDLSLVIALMYAISYYRIKNKQLIINTDLNLLSKLEKEVELNNVPENLYLTLCSHLQIHNDFTSFFEYKDYDDLIYFSHEGKIRIKCL